MCAHTHTASKYIFSSSTLECALVEIMLVILTLRQRLTIRWSSAQATAIKVDENNNCDGSQNSDNNTSDHTA
jgi:hypothetical protein